MPPFDNLLGLPLTPEMQGLFSNVPTAQAQAPTADPNAAPAAAPAGPPSLLDKVGSALQRFGQTIGGADPSHEFTSLLSPDEIAAARPGVAAELSNFGKASPNDLYRQNLINAAQNKTTIAGILRQQQILTDRAAYYKDNPTPTDASEQDSLDYMRKAYMAAAARGDVEEMQKFNPVLAKMFAHADATHVGAAYVNTQTGQTQYFSEEPGTLIGPEWKQIPKSAGSTPQIFKLGTPGPNGESYDYLGPGQIKKGDEPVSAANAQYVQNMTQGRFDTTQLDQATAGVKKTLAPLLTQAAFFPQWESVLAQAKAGNPNATKSIVVQLAQQADPKVQLRLGTLDFIKVLDPSYTGRFAAFLAATKDGTIPPDQLANAEKLVEDLHEASRRYYTTQYAAIQNAFPQYNEAFINRTLSKPEDVFGPQPGGKGTGSNLYTKYGLNPPS